MGRIIRIAGCLVIVLVVYGLYAQIVVPWIEPPVEHRLAEASGPVVDPLAGRFRQLAALFPEGAWQLRQPKILESEQAKLLFDRYETQPDGKVLILPCTMIVLPEGPPETEAVRLAQAYVLEAPQGAVLQFDEQPDLRRAQIGRLTGGMLRGTIVIRSAGKEPGPEDDLRIETRDVQLSDREVWTPHDVALRYGPNTARGREMHIQLAPAESSGDAKHGPNIGGIETFELRQVERLYFAPQTAAAGPEPAPAATGPPGAPFSGKFEQLPVELSCQGRFFFDLAARRATFENRVDVLRIHPDGPSDQLNCELLSVFFEPARNPQSQPPRTARKKGRPALPDLEARTIVAEGNPVVVTAPTQRVHARGRRLEYDLGTGQITLADDRTGGEVFIRQGTNEVHAPSLAYCPDASGKRLGTVVADGAGWLRGHMEDRPDALIEAHWQRRLQVVPDGPNHVISLTGGAILQHQSVGRLDSREIHFWVAETPQTVPGQPNLRPVSMLSQGNVQIRSPQLTAGLQRLEMGFVEPPARKRRAAAAVAASPGEPAPAPPADEAGTPWDWMGENSDPNAPKPHFEVAGRLLQASVLLRGNDSVLQDLLVQDGVTIRQTQTARPDEQPVFIGGDSVRLTGASGPAATVTLVGQPAHFQGFGMGISGPEIHVDRGANRMWIPGGGTMDLPMDRDMEGKPLARPVTLRIAWQQAMNFNGQTVRFEGGVTATTPLQQLATQTLEVELAEPVRFADKKLAQRPDVRSMSCWGSVRMENRTFDDAGQQISLERLETASLTFDRTTGDFEAGGPGWLSSVRYGMVEALGEEPAGQQPIRPVALEQPKPRELRGLTIRFLQKIGGNRLSRQLAFYENVQLAFAPVASWDVLLPLNAPDQLGPKGITLRSDTLTVREMAVPMAGERAIEVEAVGNTIVESVAYTARAQRITYAEAFDRLVLEGDGRTPVRLEKQDVVGGPVKKHSARKILFWPKTKTVRVEDAMSVDISR